MPVWGVPYGAMPSALGSVGRVCSISPTIAAVAVAYAPGGSVTGLPAGRGWRQRRLRWWRVANVFPLVDNLQTALFSPLGIGAKIVAVLAKQRAGVAVTGDKRDGILTVWKNPNSAGSKRQNLTVFGAANGRNLFCVCHVVPFVGEIVAGPKSSRGRNSKPLCRPVMRGSR